MLVTLTVPNIQDSAGASSCRSLKFPAGGVYLDYVDVPPLHMTPSVHQLEQSVELLNDDIVRAKAVIKSELVLVKIAEKELRRIMGELQEEYTKEK